VFERASLWLAQNGIDLIPISNSLATCRQNEYVACRHYTALLHIDEEDEEAEDEEEMGGAV